MKDIKTLVNDTVKKYNTKNVYELCNSLQVGILFEELGKNIKGFYENCFGCPIIHINQDLNDTEKRITLAHELGHVLLHSNLNILFLENNTFNIKNKYERQANKFAIELLIDDTELQELKFKNMTIQQMASCLNVPEELLLFKFII